MKQIVPISETGLPGPARPATGSYVDWPRHELVEGLYGEFALVEADGRETIHRIMPVPVRIESDTIALRIWLETDS